MKVYQIISERKQLNEFVPVMLGGMGFAGAMAVIGAFITGMSIIEIYRTLSKYNEDPNSLSDDDWDNVFIDIALLALPGAARLGRAAIVKMLPRSVVRKGSAAVRKKVYEKLAKEKKAADTKYGSAAQAGKTPQQAAKMQQKLNKINTKARAKAQAKIKSFPPKVWNAITVGIGTKYAIEYWEKLSELEDQYERWVAGDRTTELFGNIENKAEVDQLANQERNRLIGQLVIGVGAAVGGLAAAKATQAMGNMFGKGVGAGTGSKLAGGLISLTAGPAALLIKYAGPGLTLFLSTETGQKAISSVYVDWIVSGLGNVTAKTMDLIYDGIDALAKKVGIDGATDKLRSPIKDPSADKADASGVVTPAMLDKTPAKMRVGTDPKNPKIKLVGGVQITDAEGFQAVGNNYLASIKREAQALKLPDPTAGIPKKPGVNYNY
jgi:hypothetical protein